MDSARGRGVQQDQGEAVQWVRRAAIQGYALAQYSLGIAYAIGQ
jgi:TPR repeat protein